MFNETMHEQTLSRAR